MSNTHTKKKVETFFFFLTLSFTFILIVSRGSIARCRYCFLFLEFGCSVGFMREELLGILLSASLLFRVYVTSFVGVSLFCKDGVLSLFCTSSISSFPRFRLTGSGGVPFDAFMSSSFLASSRPRRAPRAGNVLVDRDSDFGSSVFARFCFGGMGSAPFSVAVAKPDFAPSCFFRSAQPETSGVPAAPRDAVCTVRPSVARRCGWRILSRSSRLRRPLQRRFVLFCPSSE